MTLYTCVCVLLCGVALEIDHYVNKHCCDRLPGRSRRRLIMLDEMPSITPTFGNGGQRYQQKSYMHRCIECHIHIYIYICVCVQASRKRNSTGRHSQNSIQRQQTPLPLPRVERRPARAPPGTVFPAGSRA